MSGIFDDFVGKTLTELHQKVQKVIKRRGTIQVGHVQKAVKIDNRYLHNSVKRADFVLYFDASRTLRTGLYMQLSCKAYLLEAATDFKHNLLVKKIFNIPTRSGRDVSSRLRLKCLSENIDVVDCEYEEYDLLFDTNISGEFDVRDLSDTIDFMVSYNYCT